MRVDINKTPDINRKFFENIHERIVSFWQACALIELAKKNGIPVVLAQGVFDIIHPGHIDYLEGASDIKEEALLFVGLENDTAARLNKGQNRPINPLDDRLKVIAAMRCVHIAFAYLDAPDYTNPEDFTNRFVALSPNILAVSKFDPSLQAKQQQAKAADVEINVLTGEKIHSTTRIISKINDQ